MLEEKIKTIQKLSELLSITTLGFQELFWNKNDFTGDVKEVKIFIMGAAVRTVNVEGDSPEQIVKDILNTIWRMK